MLKKSYAVAFALTASLSGCGTFVPVENLSQVSDTELRESAKVKVYMLGSMLQPEQKAEVIDYVEAYSCKHMMYDPPASKGDALKRLRLNAHRLGADAVLDVTIDSTGTDTFGTNCWESISASGQAVKFQ